MTYLVSNRYTIYRQMICFFLLLSRALYLPRKSLREVWTRASGQNCCN